LAASVALLDGLAPLLAAVDSPTDAGVTVVPGAVAELLDHWPDARIKLYLTARGLRLRRQHPEVFLWGGYQPLQSDVTVNADILGFVRRSAAHVVVAIVPRLSATIAAPGQRVALGFEAWQTSRVFLDSELGGRQWRNVLTGEHVKPVERAGPPASGPHPRSAAS
jgi:(1->4)-alpha-D-glucan 1-alpha-D-glucosylmutase